MTSINPYIAAESTRELFYGLVELGIDKRTLVEMSGINSYRLEECERRFLLTKHVDLWRVAEQITFDPLAGLKIGLNSDPARFGITGLVFMASPDLEMAINNLIRFSKIITGYTILERSQACEQFSLIYLPDAQNYYRQEVERALGCLRSWVQLFVQQDNTPLRVNFKHDAADSEAAYLDHLVCEARFNQAENSIQLPEQLLTKVNENHNSYLYNILIARAERVLSQIHSETDFADKVRVMIGERLMHGNFLAEDLAQSLNVSKRTFYRKLRDQGVSYQSLLDDVRKEIAVTLMTHGEDYQRVTSLLGYSDTRVFSRAFKRWTDCSPREYMQKSLQVA